MIDSFWESQHREFIQSPLKERGQYPSCPGGVIRYDIAAGYAAGVHTATSFPLGHPGGYWGFKMIATVRGASGLPDGYPTPYYSIHALLIRTNAYNGAQAEIIGSNGGVVTRPVAVRFGGADIHSPVPSGISYSYTRQPGDFFRFLYYGPAALGVPAEFYGASNEVLFYTWTFPPGAAVYTPAELFVREPTPYCNPQFYLMLYSGQVPCDLLVECRRYDYFIVKFIYSSVGGHTIQFTDATIISNEYGIGAGQASRSWTFGDGGSSTLRSPQHTYAAAGTYTVRLTITDLNGAETHSEQQSVVVP